MTSIPFLEQLPIAFKRMLDHERVGFPDPLEKLGSLGMRPIRTIRKLKELY